MLKMRQKWPIFKVLNFKMERFKCLTIRYFSLLYLDLNLRKNENNLFRS